MRRRRRLAERRLDAHCDDRLEELLDEAEPAAPREAAALQETEQLLAHAAQCVVQSRPAAALEALEQVVATRCMGAAGGRRASLPPSAISVTLSSSRWDEGDAELMW